MLRLREEIALAGTCLLALAVMSCAFAAGTLSAGEKETPVENSLTKEGHERRIIHAWDGCTMWGTILSGSREIPGDPAQFSKRILEEMIDEEAAAHVDAISYCLFTAFWSDLPSSKITDLCSSSATSA